MIVPLVLGKDLGEALDGVLQEYRVFKSEGLLHVPKHLSYEEAACWPCAGVTAWNALFNGNPLAPGQTVLFQGTGGVSMAGLLFAASAGAKAGGSLFSHIIPCCNRNLKIEGEWFCRRLSRPAQMKSLRQVFPADLLQYSPESNIIFFQSRLLRLPSNSGPHTRLTTRHTLTGTKSYSKSVSILRSIPHCSLLSFFILTS